MVARVCTLSTLEGRGRRIAKFKARLSHSEILFPNKKIKRAGAGARRWRERRGPWGEQGAVAVGAGRALSQ